MARILWISDAGTSTGFSRVTHAVGERLVRDHGHDVHVLAVGWKGGFPYEGPLHLYGAEAGPARHYLGYDRVADLIERIEPDVVVTLEDPPQLRRRLHENKSDPQKLLLTRQPVISYIPVDSYHLPPAWLDLKGAVTMVAMSRHGQEQLKADHMAYHGVDTDIFYPVDERPIMTSRGEVKTRAECREAFGIPQDAFVVGRVDTNSGRKDWGSTWRTIDAFQRMQKRQPDEIVSVFHTIAKNPTSGVDLAVLISKGPGKYMVTNRSDWPVGDVVAIVNTFDVFLTTSRGEGFGLTIAEALACGVPVIATDTSAIPEVVGPGGILTRPKAWMTNPYGVDLQLSDTDAMAAELSKLHRAPDLRRSLGGMGLKHVRETFSWDACTDLFNHLIDERASSGITQIVSGPAG